MNKTTKQDNNSFWAGGLLTLILLAILIYHHYVSDAGVPAYQPSAVSISSHLPDFSKIKDVQEKKSQFFAWLRPIVRMENQKILMQRTRLKQLAEQLDGDSVHSQPLRRKLLRLKASYDIDDNKVAGYVSQSGQSQQQATIALLMRRIDVIPESLVLVQAANESAWGTSRFAREANNLFGQWCFKRGCGLVPSGRSEGKSHEVRKFRTPAASVASYLKNLNTHNAYTELRDIRYQLRQNGESITASHLLEGLHHYSERGEAYVDELKAMIRINKLE